MSVRSALRPIALAAMALSCAASVHAGGDAAALLADSAALTATTDQLVLRLDPKARGAFTLDTSAVASVMAAHGVSVRHVRERLDSRVIKLDHALPNAEAAALARALAATDGAIVGADADRRAAIDGAPNDTLYPDQWHYFEPTGGINAKRAWKVSTGRGVVVAVLDTGYRPHVDLAANLIPGYDMIIDTAVSNDGDGRDADASDPGDWTTAGECYAGSPARNSSWHGTHVSGTVAAVTNNAQGVAGVAYDAKVQPVRVLGTCGGYFSDIEDGITWASGGSVAGVPANPTPANVINMSLGGSGSCPSSLQSAINAAVARGTVVVVSAGNSNVNASSATPANCNNVITVAATGRNGGKAPYSNYGAVVEIAAPGGDYANGVLSTLNAGATTPGADAYAGYIGTSMAAPHVSAVAAMMLSTQPGWSPAKVLNRMQKKARAFPATCSQCGSGIVDAKRSIKP